ncbi:MAG TPA: hypothetical protein VKV95_13100 [Terriglobia bacterium]|nr:hypothetical protein [Terriglobia bacterium]
MKTFLRMAGVFVLALSLGIFLAPRAGSVAQLTASALGDQIQSIAAQLQSSMDALTPGVAVRVATLLIVLGAVIAGSFLYLLVFVPLRIHFMHGEMRRQREEIQAMKSEIHLSSELLMDARRDYEGQSGKVQQREVAARARLRQWTFPGRDGQQTKDAARH